MSAARRQACLDLLQSRGRLPSVVGGVLGAGGLSAETQRARERARNRAVSTAVSNAETLPMSTAADAGGVRLVTLAFGALGVVYGDIGTSPLYAVRECFGEHGVAQGPVREKEGFWAE